MAPEDVVILSIATRPDCLGPDILGLLEDLNRVKPVWVELGLQTIHPESARYLRRGYDLPVFDRAVKDLKAIGVTVIVHQILGLPGETPEMMAETARYIGQSGAEGVKLHLLHVLRNTDLAAEWQAGRVRTLELEEYISILELCLRNLPPETVIHRLTGDGAKRDLLAPLWSGDKKRVLNAIHQAFLRDNLIQEAPYKNVRRMEVHTANVFIIYFASSVQTLTPAMAMAKREPENDQHAG
ncbi:MAG: radical SAM protein [Dysosmobacter sp.]